MKSGILAALLLVVLAGCTAPTTVPSTSMAASEVMATRAIESPTSVYISPDVALLSQKVAVSGYSCSAWNFPTSVGPGLAETLRLTNDQALKHPVPGGTQSEPGAGASYHIIFDQPEYDPRISIAPQFWSGLADASAELTLRVRVIDAKGMEIIKTIVSGEGSAQQSGDCEAMSGALAAASGKAVKRIAENYVEKVINTGLFH